MSLDIVRALLAQHSPADASEAASLVRINDLLDTSSEPFSREHYVPGHLTASGIVVNPERSNTLLIFHAKLQRWLQPGGHFELGESDPAIAAAREVLEETGVQTRAPGPRAQLLDVDAHEIPARKNVPAHVHFDLRMLLLADDTDCALTLSEVTDARWAGRREFSALKLDSGTLRALKKCGL